MNKLSALLCLIVAWAASTWAVAASANGNGSSVEAELKTLTATTFKSFGDLRKVLGVPEQAAKDADNAACLMAKRCTLEGALDTLRSSAEALRDDVRGRKADDNRLGSPFAQAAVEALTPAVQTMPQWTRVARNLRPAALGKVAPKLPLTTQSVFEAIRAAVDYLGFSGAPTQPLEAALAAEATAK